MVRQLPIYQLGDEQFYVDLQRWQFRQVNNPLNAISLDHLRDLKDHTLLYYDKATKNAFTGTAREWKAAGDRVIPIKLPVIGALDYEGAKKIITSQLMNRTQLNKAREILSKKSKKRAGRSKKK
jgi:hypothetical protein